MLESLIRVCMGKGLRGVRVEQGASVNSKT
jgi:hypothetical protein